MSNTVKLLIIYQWKHEITGVFWRKSCAFTCTRTTFSCSYLQTFFDL